MIQKRQSEIFNDDQNRNYVSIMIEQQYLDSVLEFYHNMKIKNERQGLNESFMRRLVPFFLNQFYHWSVKNNYKEVVKCLNNLKKSKRSLQKKFELGDLKILFSENCSQFQISERIQSETQQKWKEFLENDAEQIVWKNNKIKCTQTKEFYVQSVPILLFEVQQVLPYDKLLSKYRNLDKVFIIKNQTETSFSFEDYINQPDTFQQQGE